MTLFLRVSFDEHKFFISLKSTLSKSFTLWLVRLNPSSGIFYHSKFMSTLSSLLEALLFYLPHLGPMGST